MRKTFTLFLVIGVMILSSCSHPHTQGPSLTLKFTPVFGSGILRLNSTYQTPAPYDQYFNFSGLQFFLSHITLVRANGSSVEVSPLVYITLADSTTYNITLADSLGSFTALKFNIGVDSVQDSYNITYPTNSNPSYPLNQAVVQENMYWGSAQEFVFVKMDVEVDTLSSLTQSDGLPYHVGTQPYYTPVQLTFSQAFSVSAGAQSVINLSTDFQKIFTGTNAINPLVEHGTMTTGSNDTLAFQFINKLSQSFTLQ